MTRTSLLAFVAAALAFAARPALAQHDHGAMHGAMQQGQAGGAAADGSLKNGVRTVELSVTDDGFVPAKVSVKKGEKVRLVVTRKTSHTCATEIVIKDHGIHAALPLDKAVTVEFTPSKSGQIRYACGMDMVSGVVSVM